MKRRDFIKTGAITGVIAITQPAAAASATRFSESPLPAFELEEVTISELQQGISSGKYTARSLAKK